MNVVNVDVNADISTDISTDAVCTLHGTDGSVVRIALHGAHVLSWIPAGASEHLFLSTRSIHAPGVAIRGGIPVIFPQFAALGTLPKHGFARTAMWQQVTPSPVSGVALAQDVALFEMRSTAATLALWPHAFLAQLRVILSAITLELELTIHNTDDKPFLFTAALHTYLRVSQIADVGVQGLRGVYYRDSVTATSGCLEVADVLRIKGEVDRIYQQAPALLEVDDTTRRIRIEHQGFVDAVVWNPGEEGGAKMADMEECGYAHMLCVEGGVIVDPIWLQPGAQWRGSQRLTALTDHAS